MGKGKQWPKQFLSWQWGAFAAEDLRDICDSNGLSKEEFVRGRFAVPFLEYFLSSPPNMGAFEWFPMLRDLQPGTNGTKWLPIENYVLPIV